MGTGEHKLVQVAEESTGWLSSEVTWIRVWEWDGAHTHGPGLPRLL